MKATTRRGGAGAGALLAKKKKKKAPAARGFMCGCGGANSVSIVPRAAGISAVATTPMKAASAASAAAKAAAVEDDDMSAEGTPSVDTLLEQLRELERGVRALGVRDRAACDDDDGADATGSAARRRPARARHVRSASDWGGGVGRLDASSVAVVTESADPLADFRRSMVQMIVENGITGGAELRELLQRFLSLNSARHHHLILRAFADVWEDLFAGGGHGLHVRPSPPPPLPAAEKIPFSYPYSSRRGSSKQRPHSRADTLTAAVL